MVDLGTGEIARRGQEILLLGRLMEGQEPTNDMHVVGEKAAEPRLPVPPGVEKGDTPAEMAEDEIRRLRTIQVGQVAQRGEAGQGQLARPLRQAGGSAPS